MPTKISAITGFLSMGLIAVIAMFLISLSINGNTTLEACLDEDFRQLTLIGNNFKIRHTETNQMQLEDARYYDYFFYRCLSTIALAVGFIQK